MRSVSGLALVAQEGQEVSAPRASRDASRELEKVAAMSRQLKLDGSCRDIAASSTKDTNG
jgi:hypothetical protein